MTHAIPPELLAPEHRVARTEELRGQIGREWVRFAIRECLLLGLPFIVSVVLWGTQAISDTTALVLWGTAGVLSAAHAGYTIKLRTGPLVEEIQRLERLEGVGP